MRGRPAEQEKATAKVKRSPKRVQPTTRRTVMKRKAAPEAPEVVEKVKLEELAQADTTLPPDTTPSQAAAPLLVPTPTFVSRNIVAPDGSVRPGWEMWIGDHCFGRADSKELLLASFQRLQSPPESFHWREVRNRMQMRGRPRPTIQAEPEKDETWEKEETEEPLLLGEEETDGFQELTWDNA